MSSSSSNEMPLPCKRGVDPWIGQTVNNIVNAMLKAWALPPGNADKFRKLFEIAGNLLQTALKKGAEPQDFHYYLLDVYNEFYVKTLMKDWFGPPKFSELAEFGGSVDHHTFFISYIFLPLGRPIQAFSDKFQELMDRRTKLLAIKANCPTVFSQYLNDFAQLNFDILCPKKNEQPASKEWEEVSRIIPRRLLYLDLASDGPTYDKEKRELSDQSVHYIALMDMAKQRIKHRNRRLACYYRKVGTSLRTDIMINFLTTGFTLHQVINALEYYAHEETPLDWQKYNGQPFFRMLYEENEMPTEWPPDDPPMSWLPRSDDEGPFEGRLYRYKPIHLNENLKQDIFISGCTPYGFLEFMQNCPLPYFMLVELFMINSMVFRKIDVFDNMARILAFNARNLITGLNIQSTDDFPEVLDFDSRLFLYYHYLCRAEMLIQDPNRPKDFRFEFDLEENYMILPELDNVRDFIFDYAYSDELPGVLKEIYRQEMMAPHHAPWYLYKHLAI